MHPQHHTKVNELIDLEVSGLRLEVERLYRSGAIDINSYNPDNYILAKILLATALLNHAEEMISHIPIPYKNEIKNLRKF